MTGIITVVLDCEARSPGLSYGGSGSLQCACYNYVRGEDILLTPLLFISFTLILFNQLFHLPTLTVCSLYRCTGSRPLDKRPVYNCLTRSIRVVTKTWNYLQPPKTTYNHLQPPTTIYNHLRKFNNHLQPPKKIQQPPTTTSKTSKTRHKCLQ